MRNLTIAIAFMALLSAGCSDANRYGDEGVLEGTDGTGGQLVAPSTTSPPTTAPPATAPPGPSTTQPAPSTTARPVQAYPIRIQSDRENTQFEPRVAQVFVGNPVTWTNTDSAPRSVEFADQSYVSGPIPPGGSATFTPKRSGQFNYSDGTRPYAVGTLRVQPR